MKRLFIWLDKLIKKQKELKRWKRIVTVLAAILTFATTYALILPAITVERNRTDEIGGMYLEQDEEWDELLLDNALEPSAEDLVAGYVGTGEEVVEEKSAPAVRTLNAAGDDYTVILTYDETSKIPEGADLIVSEIAEDSEEYQIYLEETKKAMGLAEEETLPRFAARFFDIKIMVGEDEFRPESGVSVEITYAEPLAEKADAEVSAVHFAEETAEAEVIEASQAEVQEDGVSTVEFTAESFSVYGVIYTVDFQWEVNGRTYEFSIPGGGFVSLQQLVEELGIAKTEEAQDFVSEVENVEFSEPSLVWVGKISESGTVGWLKEEYGLECQYSAELTEEQIAEINNSVVESGDWALISMLPFETEEMLTVTMKNGVAFTVGVTDDRVDYSGSIVSGNKYYIYTYSANANYAVGYNGSAAQMTDINNPGLGNDYLWTFTNHDGYWLIQNVGHPDTYLDLKNGNVTSTSGTGITIADWYDGTGGFVLSNYNNNNYTWSSLIIDMSVNPRTRFQTVDGLFGSRMRLLDEVTTPTVTPTPAMGNHVTIHYVDRNGNVLTNITKKSTCNSSVVANADGTFSIPYNINGNVDLRADFDFTDVTNATLEIEHAEYTYANSHLDGKDASGKSLKHEGYLIDSRLTSSFSGLQFASDSGETNYSPNNNPPIGNLKYGNLTSTLLSDRITRRTGDSDRPILYASSNNKDIYVILDPLPENTTEALNSTNIDAEAPKLTKDMAPNHDGTYTLSLKVDAHGRNVSETNKANILFVVDTSSSMRNKTQNGSTRIIDTHDAVRSLGRKLLDYNDEHPDAVEVAMLTFDGSVDERLNWTKNKTTFTNAVDEYLRYYYLHTGTDWEDGMRNALNKLLSNSTDDDPTFVIFFTDGEPSQYTNFSGKGENNNTDVPDPITHGTVHESVSGGYPNFYSYFLSREGSKDEMRAVVDTGAMLYGIYAYNTTTEGYTSYNGREDGAAMLHNAIKYGYNTSESLKDNLFYEAKNTDDLKGAFDKIYNLITEKVGFTNVVVKDGIATGVTSSTVVNGDVSGFTYIIRDNNNALAYQVTVAPNGVPDGMTVEDDTPIFTFSEGGTPCIGEKKQVTFTRIIKDGNGNPILDENDEIQTEQATDWVYYYKDADNKEYIMPIATTGTEVKWDLSPLGLLKDGYSYELDFVVWPNQDAYDLVADLNNGLRTDLEASAHWEDKPILKDQDQKEYQIGGFEDYPYISRYVETGVYSAMSNTGQGVDFYKADVKIVNGQEVTEITHPDPDPVDPPGPMPLTATESQIEKQWNVDRNPRVLTELLYGKKDPVTKEWIPFSITFGVFIEDPTGEATDPTDPDNPDDPTNPDNPTDPDNPDDPTDPDNPTDPDAPADETEEEPYKSVTLGWNDAWDKETHDYEWVDTPATDNVEYDGVGHKVGTRWAQDFSIATGIMLDDEHMEARHLNKSLFPSFVYKNKTYYILEEGHDYRLEENPKLSYDFDAPETEFHPMLVNGKLQSVTFSRNEAGKITGIDAMTDEENGISSLKVENTLRGYINLRKVVVGRDGTSLRPTDETKFFYHISLVNPTPVFDGDHIPWYAVNGLYYHDDDFNYYQAYLDEQHNLKICTESGTLDHPYDAEIGTIDPETEEFVPGGTFDENDVTGQAIRFNDGSGARVVIIKGNRTAAAADQHSTEADMWINRNETLSIANVPLGTEYTITETQTDGYQLVSVVSNQSENDKADIRISGYEITGNIIQNANNDVTYTNKVIDGSLQITKNVTVDGQPAVGTDFATWADGEYFFTITDANGKPAVGKVGNNWIGKDGKVRVVIENGVSKTVTVTDMRIGEYTITEDKPNNGTTLVEFKVDGSAKTVENGVVVDDDDKKITVVENETTTTSFTNNINPTSVEVQKVWTDDRPTGASHSGQDIVYEIYRTPYVMVDDPENPGNKIEQMYRTQVKVDSNLVPTMQGYTGTLCYTGNSSTSWKEVVTRLPKTEVIWDEDNEVYIYLTYKYTVKEKTIVEGYKTVITGGEIDDEDHPGEYSYGYTITNEPLGPTDQNTQIDVKKEWNNADGTPDTDPHMDDTVVFKVTQKMYEAKVKFVYNGVTYENIPLYPITIVVRDKQGSNGPDRITNETLSTVVYVPAGAEFRITTIEANPDKVTNTTDHFVEGYGLVEETGYVKINPGQTYTVPQVNSAMEITLDLHAGFDLWVDDFDEDDETVDYHYWKYRLYSPQGIIWHLEELQERVLDNISDATGAEPVPCEGYPVDYSYTIELTEENGEVYTSTNTVENAPGHGVQTDEVWQGSITHLPLYEYQENSQGTGGTSYIYTYEVEEAAINTDTVNTTDPPANWKGQTTFYLATWEQNTDKEDEEYGLWTLTNQKKPPIDVTLYKVDKNDIPSSSTRLEGAKFKLVKKKLVHEGEHHWVWSKDTSWGTAGESEVVSENPQNPGIFSFENLDAGYYEIVETERPYGYAKTAENPVFEVRYNNGSAAPEIILVYASGENIGQPITGNETDMVKVDNKAIIVGNELGAALPNAGGLGTTLFYLVGILLTGIAGAVLVLRRRRRTV